MQEQINGIVTLATLEATQPLGWQIAAVGEYERSWPVRRADLRRDLSARILALTGRRMSAEEIYADGHMAVAGVDGVTFRLHHSRLVLARTCDYQRDRALRESKDKQPFRPRVRAVGLEAAARGL